MKELDVLLERYLVDRFRGATPHEQQAFRRLLEIQDAALYAYCLGSVQPPAEFTALIGRITAYAVTQAAPAAPNGMAPAGRPAGGNSPGSR